MSAIRHPNVVLFMGVCLDPPCMVTEVGFRSASLSAHVPLDECKVCARLSCPEQLILRFLVIVYANEPA